MAAEETVAAIWFVIGFCSGFVLCAFIALYERCIEARNKLSKDIREELNTNQ